MESEAGDWAVGLIALGVVIWLAWKRIDRDGDQP